MNILCCNKIFPRLILLPCLILYIYVLMAMHIHSLSRTQFINLETFSIHSHFPLLYTSMHNTPMCHPVMRFLCVPLSVLYRVWYKNVQYLKCHQKSIKIFSHEMPFISWLSFLVCFSFVTHLLIISLHQVFYNANNIKLRNSYFELNWGMLFVDTWETQFARVHYSIDLKLLAIPWFLWFIHSCNLVFHNFNLNWVI